MYLLKVFRITLQFFGLMAVGFATGLRVNATDHQLNIADDIITGSLWAFCISFVVVLTEIAIRSRRTIPTPEQGAP